jgi:hypothetical protein
MSISVGFPSKSKYTTEFWVKGPIHPKLKCAVYQCETTARRTNLNILSGSARISYQVCELFFVSSLCLFVRVIMVDKNKAVVCCLLTTSAIMLSENNKRKRKMWTKKWYLKMNITYDAHPLNELLETDAKIWLLEMMPSWCRQVKWENCGIPWVNCAFLCVKDDWKGQFWGLRYSLSKLRSLFSFSVRYDVTQ